jgi:hypothetical protein
MTISKLSLSLVDLCRAKWADRWFDILNSTVYQVTDENRKENQKRVRVAILDTGVDATHPVIHAAQKQRRIVDCFPSSRAPDRSSDDPLCDTQGHGTHGASVLLRTAPNANLYIARVTDQDGNLIYDEIPKVCLISHFGLLILGN